MDKKKILFASLFVAIMLLVPFTAVGTHSIGYNREKELERESEQGNKNLDCSKCSNFLKCWSLRFEKFKIHWKYSRGKISFQQYLETTIDILKLMEGNGCILFFDALISP